MVGPCIGRRSITALVRVVAVSGARGNTRLVLTYYSSVNATQLK